MKKYAAPIGILIVVLFGAWFLLKTHPTSSPVGEKACTAEAKICPDGSAVGRTGPDCEFAACPAVVTTTATTTLAFDESATVNGITLTPKELVEDSRCPSGVQCIQAGTVRVRVSIDSYNGDLVLSLGKPNVLRNMIIVLSSVLPAEKKAKQSVPADSYRFTFTLVPLVANEPGAGIP